MDSEYNKPDEEPVSQFTENINDTQVLEDEGKQDSQVNNGNSNVIKLNDDTEELKATETDLNVATESNTSSATEGDTIAMENHNNTAKENDSNLAKENDVKVELQLKKLETIADKLSVDSDIKSPQQLSIRVQDTDSDSDVSKSGSKTGFVKDTLYGTPVINVASSYTRLPSDNNFAKDICDVINFENLPNSTGKYKQISNLLKKVKDEVDRIHDT